MNQASIRTNRVAIAKRTARIEDFVSEKLAIIERLNPSLLALAHVARDHALAAARSYDQCHHTSTQELALGRLSGSTFSTRLSIEVQGLPLSNGSVTQEPVISDKSGALVSKIESQGAICLGKGNIAERGRSYYSENPRYGRSNHYIDPSLSPGGSGGGDAVAVATGMVDFAIGADAGGSVRVPANFCGIFGLTATHGVLSEATGHASPQPLARILKSLGIFARSLDDLDILFSVCEGFDALDPYSTAAYFSPKTKQNRFLVCQSLRGVSPVAEIQLALEYATKRFQKSGHVAQHQVPGFFDDLLEPYIILAGQAQLILDDALEARTGLVPDRSLEGPHLKMLRSRVASELPPLSAEQLLMRLYQLDGARIAAATLFKDIDFIIMPVAATLPTPHNTASYTINGQNVRSEEVFQFSSLVNALGLPAIAVPCPATSTGIPTGFQIVGPRYSEKLLLRLIREAGF